MPDSPKHGDSEGTAATHRQCDRLAHAGTVRTQDTLGRAQPSAAPCRDCPRPCDTASRVDLLFVLSRLPAGTRGLMAAPERRACLQRDKAIGSPGRTDPAAPDRTGRRDRPRRHIDNAAHPNGNGLPAADRFCRWHAHCRVGDLKARPFARAVDGSSRKTSGCSQRSRGAYCAHHAAIC